MFESWDENDSGMAKSNAKTFANVIECDSEEDIEYKVESRYLRTMVRSETPEQEHSM